MVFHSATNADSPLAHVVVAPSSTCAGGAYIQLYMDIRQHGNAVYVGMVVVVCIPIIYMYTTKIFS